MSRRAQTVGAGALLMVLTWHCVTGRPVSPADPPLLAAVESSDGVEILRRDTEGVWRREALLPKGARAIRFLAGGDLAWLEDDTSSVTPKIHAHTRQGGEVPVPRVVRTPPRSAVGLLPESGRTDCVTPTICGTALRVLDWPEANDFLVATNEGAVWHTASATLRSPLVDVVGGRLGAGEALLIHRVTESDRVVDALSVWTTDGRLRELTRAPVLVDAEVLGPGRYAVVRRTERRDLYEELLAHAPEEFGGEAMGGEAVQIESDGSEHPVRGLEGRSVRAIVRPMR